MMPSAMAAPGGNGASRSDQLSASDFAIVQFNTKPVADYTGDISGLAATKAAPGHKLDLNSNAARAYGRYVSSVHQNFHAWLHSNAAEVEVLKEYSVVFDGVAVQLHGKSIDSLRSGPDVVDVSASWLYKPSMDVSVPLIHAPAVWTMLGPDPNNPALPNLNGVKVGVIDTGIDDSHEFIASCRAAGSIQHKVFFSGLGTADPSRTLFFDHGTHVSGEIGGCPITHPVPVGDFTLSLAGTLQGVAPGVSLADYNVFPGYGAGFIAFGGSAFSHDIIDAVEAAVADGMDVINLSLGGTVQGPHDTLAMALNAAADAGTLPVVAAGNSGPNFLTVESPGNAAGALTAGASTNVHYLGIRVRLDDAAFGADQGKILGAAIGDFANFDPAKSAATSLTTPANGCTAIAEDLTGKLAVINRGTCTFGTKIQNAQDRRAIGVVMVNNVGGDPIAMGQDGVNHPTIPAAMVSQSDGNTYLRTHPGAVITVDGTTRAEIVTTNADVLAGFSSKGPTPYDFRIKPDVTAPGVNILSSVLGGKYAFFQGTSMATPHTAGSAALLKALHPSWGPEEIKSALVNNADRTVTGTSGLGPIARGGGRINVERAAGASIFLDPVSVSFGVWTGSKDATASVAVAFMNEGESSVTCSLSVITGSPASAPVSVSLASLTIAAGATESAVVALAGGKTLATDFYWGDVKAVCGSVTLLTPWWTGVQRGNGFLNGNQHSPADAVSGFDPDFYGDPAFFVAGVWTG